MCPSLIQKIPVVSRPPHLTHLLCSLHRPTFQYFTWHTCVLGIAGCVVMVFLISPIYASASVAFMILLLLALHYLSPSSSWGYISQALIFHQVSTALQTVLQGGWPFGSALIVCALQTHFPPSNLASKRTFSGRFLAMWM